MKKCLWAGIVLLACAILSPADLWTEDFNAAQNQARESGKYMLVNFSGSDWCGWCKRLDMEVFSRPEFETFAKENLVCVLVDFPRETPQSNKQRWANELLRIRYEVEGYPTILLFNPQGIPVAMTSYQPGGAEEYIRHLQGLIEQDKARQSPAPK